MVYLIHSKQGIRIINNAPITIRQTQIKDIRFLPEIEQSAGQRFFDTPHLAWTADLAVMSTETHLKYVMQGTSWVAAANGQIVGFLCAEAEDSDFHIWEFAVRKEWQGNGIGRCLIKTAIHFAHRKKFTAVTLTTFLEVPWNEPFYRSLGFEVLNLERLDQRLKKILYQETQHGIPGELRCAMRLVVSPRSNHPA